MKETLDELYYLRDRSHLIQHANGLAALTRAIAVIKAATELMQHRLAPLNYGHCTAIPVEKAYLDALIAAIKEV